MKRPVNLVQAVSALLVAGAFGCSLIVDASDVDAGCPDGQKFCGGACVEISNPTYGCTPTGCADCKLAHARGRCEGTVCKVDMCEYGFGCPVDGQGCGVAVLSNPSHCGSCENACDGEQVCRNGECVPVEAQ